MSPVMIIWMMMMKSGSRKSYLSRACLASIDELFTDLAPSFGDNESTTQAQQHMSKLNGKNNDGAKTVF
jgi:hypothetical protein